MLRKRRLWLLPLFLILLAGAAWGLRSQQTPMSGKVMLAVMQGTGAAPMDCREVLERPARHTFCAVLRSPGSGVTVDMVGRALRGAQLTTGTWWSPAPDRAYMDPHPDVRLFLDSSTPGWSLLWAQPR